jgi:hypothetical protein
MEIVKLEIMISDADVLRFFTRHGLKCNEVTVPVTERAYHNREANRTEKRMVVVEPHSGMKLDARDAMLRIIQRRTVSLLLDDCERTEVFMQLREMGKKAENLILD